MQIVSEFWNRRPVKGVGLAMKLNWDDQTASQSQNAQIKEIRKDAVRYYTGLGNASCEDGIFTKE